MPDVDDETHFKLSDQTFITCMSICLGVPVPSTSNQLIMLLDDLADFLKT